MNRVINLPTQEATNYRTLSIWTKRRTSHLEDNSQKTKRGPPSNMTYCLFPPDRIYIPFAAIDGYVGESGCRLAISHCNQQPP